MPHHPARSLAVAALAVSLGGCASTDPFAGLSATRGVFASPYVAPEIASRQGIGPEPEGVHPSRQPYLDALHYPGRGRFALDRRGNLVRLSRDERRLLQERHERLRQRAQQAGPAAPGAPPQGLTPHAPFHGGGSLPR
jgi:hypothetical protein